MSNKISEPLEITFSIAPESVQSILNLIATASGDGLEASKKARRLEASRNAIYAGEEPPEDINLMVTRKQATQLPQLSRTVIDRLNRDGRMPPPIRIGNTVRWNRAELVAWVEAGCPNCKNWKYASQDPT